MTLPAAPEAVTLSVVVPVYNEESGLAELHRRLSAALDALDVSSEIIYVNDGSRDRSAVMLQALADSDARTVVLQLSRNFGKELAVSAGIDFARGEALVVLDADLQDPPELIAGMLEQWRNGYDCVLMRRRSREGETWLKQVTSSVFYRLLRRISDVDIPPDVGDFRLITRYMKGLFAWVGYKQIIVDYERDGRFAGDTKWNYWRLWNLALEGITSFSTAPLKLASYVGFGVAVSAFLYTAYVFVKAALVGDPVPGYPSLMVVVLFLGGTQLMALGIIGEYLARVFVEVKQRPLYLVADVYSRAHRQSEQAPASHAAPERAQ